MKKQTIVFLGIGTNKGNRKKNISNALKLLSENRNLKILKVSKMLKNPPREGIKSGYFLNGAIKLETSLKPIELLRFCKSIEKKLGRKIGPLDYGTIGEKRKKIRRYFSRTIDLDILFYGNKIIKSKELIIPHPRIEKRDFVLIPLCQMAKDSKHPISKESIRKIYLNYKREPESRGVGETES